MLVNVLFRGREMQHQQEGRRVLDLVLERLADVSKVERPPAMDGKRWLQFIPHPFSEHRMRKLGIEMPKHSGARAGGA